MSTKIQGNAGVIADVTSNKELQVRPTLTPANAGYINAQNVNDAGSITTTPYIKSSEVSTDIRNRVGVDTLLDYELFN